MWNNNYTLHFNNNPFYRHEQIILADGSCEGFLPISFLHSDRGLTARYETGGYQPLSGFRIERTEDVLYLMERTVMILHVSPEHLLAPERITLRTNTVFYNKMRDDLRIAFIPRLSDSEGPDSGGTGPGGADPRGSALDSPIVSDFHRELIVFLAQLKHDVRDSHTDFVLRLARDFYYNSPDTSGMLRTIGLLRRELEETVGDRQATPAER